MKQIKTKVGGSTVNGWWGQPTGQRQRSGAQSWLLGAVILRCLCAGGLI